MGFRVHIGVIQGIIWDSGKENGNYYLRNSCCTIGLPVHYFEEYIVLGSFLLTRSECARASVQEHGNVEALRLTNIIFSYFVYKYSTIM